MTHYTVSQLIKTKGCPSFISRVYQTKRHEHVSLPNVKCRATFLRFLEYLYCSKFVDEITVVQACGVAEIARMMGMTNIYKNIKDKAAFIKGKMYN